MTASIAARIGRLGSGLGRRLRQICHLAVVHRYDRFSIRLPAEHLLPVYQRRYPRYDRFLPVLVAALDGDPAIIDVGANCGDTLAGMVERNPRATYVCIEPDAGFFTFLQSNIARMQASIGPLSIHCVKSLVGKNVGTVSLAGRGGSRHAIAANRVAAGHVPASLDVIMAALPPLRVRLLKSDVDGFDFDVLDSAADLLNAQHPILFFETQCDTAAQLAGFQRTITWLETLAYHHWTAFDNFGAIVLRSTDAGQIGQLLGYIWQQNRGAATRTIHYLDVLACVDADVALIERVLDGY